VDDDISWGSALVAAALVALALVAAALVALALMAAALVTLALRGGGIYYELPLRQPGLTKAQRS